MLSFWRDTYQWLEYCNFSEVHIICHRICPLLFYTQLPNYTRFKVAASNNKSLYSESPPSLTWFSWWRWKTGLLPRASQSLHSLAMNKCLIWPTTFPLAKHHFTPFQSFFPLCSVGTKNLTHFLEWDKSYSHFSGLHRRCHYWSGKENLLQLAFQMMHPRGWKKHRVTAVFVSHTSMPSPLKRGYWLSIATRISQRHSSPPWTSALYSSVQWAALLLDS